MARAETVHIEEGLVLEGRYQLLRHLGDGQMSRVYVARQLSMGRNVAIKILHDELQLDAEALGRFRQEAIAVSRLHSPHTVQFYDVGEAPSGAPFIAMELLAGETLRQQLERSPVIPWHEAVAIAAQVAASLDEGHEAGILHRDLKPENVYLCAHATPLRPFAKVLDFGLAKITDERRPGRRLTRERQVVGTPAYMAPERIVRGRPVDHRADIYSLGVMCFEMLTGSLPYEEPTPVEMVLAHATEPVPEASLRFPVVPPAVDAVLATALAKDPDLRPNKASELVDRLAAALAGSSAAG